MVIRPTVFLLGLLALSGCQGHEAQPSAQDATGLHASFPGRDPRLRWDDAGNLHVVYVEEGPGARPLVARIRDAAGIWRPSRTVASEVAYPRFVASGTRTAVAFTRRSEDLPSVVVTDWPALEAGELMDH